MKFRNPDDAFNYIEAFTNLEKSPNLAAREYRLDRMFTLLDFFEHPERAFRSIHVAGSKGKGSTSAFIASALKANGFKTGLFCSPHVETYKERISSAGNFFEDAVYTNAASGMFTKLEDGDILSSLPGGLPTAFELLTLLSFLIFKDAGCEWVVFETGLGGRLDATNVITPEASVLTVIELEHTEFLGDTIAEIAGEKAGIIKPGVPVFSAVQTADAERVFRERAANAGAPVYFPADLISSITPHPASEGFAQSFTIEYSDGNNFSINLVSAGDFQVRNASLAISVLKEIMPTGFNPAAGIAETSLPGRMELIPAGASGVPLLLDGAHTVESIRSAADAFRKTVCDGDEHTATLIFGAVEGKDIKGMAEQLGRFGRIIISTPGSFKPNNPNLVYETFLRLFPTHPSIKLLKNPADALETALQTGEPVLITGSFYMVAEIRKLL